MSKQKKRKTIQHSDELFQRTVNYYIDLVENNLSTAVDEDTTTKIKFAIELEKRFWGGG